MSQPNPTSSSCRTSKLAIVIISEHEDLENTASSLPSPWHIASFRGNVQLCCFRIQADIEPDLSCSALASTVLTGAAPRFAGPLHAAFRISSIQRPARSGALMTNRSYFQFDTKSPLRRFFASSERWSSLNKR